ncbi:MAG: sialidase family protein [Novipirellula sp. JB048]
MRIAHVLLALFVIPTARLAAQETADSATQPVLVSVERIWDAAPHNAFTDLVRFKDRWFCAFREGKGHVSPDGALRVLTSTDGKKWESSALVSSADSDLRDAKLSVTPAGQLMLAGAEAIATPAGREHQSLVWLSDDGKHWSPEYEVGDRNNWLWRITWHQGQAYGFGYGCRADNRSLRLFKSSDGKNFDTLIETVDVEGTYPNETAMVFLPDGTSHCLLRQDGKPNSGYLGTSQPPYTQWSWKSLGVRIGGPEMIVLPDGRFLAAVRLYDPPVRTSLCWVDPAQGTLTEALALPSGGDTSYAGMVWHDDRLWLSYYSSHEGKTSIYLAKVRLGNETE